MTASPDLSILVTVFHRDYRSMTVSRSRAVKTPLRIREVPGSSPARRPVIPTKGFHGFPQSQQANIGTVSLSRPRPLSKYFAIHHSLIILHSTFRNLSY
jgi:hypothetical protein